MDTMGDNGQVLPTLSSSDIDTTINHEPRIRDLRLAEALGMANLHAIRRLIERHMDALRTFGEVSHLDAKPNRRGGRPSKSFYLTKKQALYITAKSDTERAALVTIQMVELFDAVTNGATISTSAASLTRADLDAIDRLARRIGLDEEDRARAALTGQALDRLRRGDRIDIDTLTAGRPAALIALPPPPSQAREERIDRAVALLRALPPELRQEGFRLMHAIKAHSEALKELKAAAQAIHSPLDTVAEILEREAIAIRQSLAGQGATGGQG